MLGYGVECTYCICRNGCIRSVIRVQKIHFLILFKDGKNATIAIVEIKEYRKNEISEK